MLILAAPQYSTFLPEGGTIKVWPLDSQEKVNKAIEGIELEVFVTSEIIFSAFENIFQRELQVSKRKDALALGEKFLLGELTLLPPASSLVMADGKPPKPAIAVHLFMGEVLACGQTN
jgi:hypothetical protein